MSLMQSYIQKHTRDGPNKQIQQEDIVNFDENNTDTVELTVMRFQTTTT